MFAVALGAMLRRTAAAGVVLFAIVFLIPQIVNALPAPWDIRLGLWMLPNTGQQLVLLHPMPSGLSPAPAAWVCLGYAVLPLVAAIWLTERRDVWLFDTQQPGVRRQPGGAVDAGAADHRPGRTTAGVSRRFATQLVGWAEASRNALWRPSAASGPVPSAGSPAPSSGTHFCPLDTNPRRSLRVGDDVGREVTFYNAMLLWDVAHVVDR